jgi:hypothetical protein
MSASPSPVTRPRPSSSLRKAGWLASASLLAVAALAPAAQAASVAPISISDQKNPTCGDFNEGWTEFKLQDANLANGVYSDGTLTITITGFVGSDSGTPGSFDWASNIGVDAVLVKAGSDKHNLYVYDPESTGDTDLSPQEGQGNGISHISFCYDADEPSAPPSTPPSTAPSTPPSTEPSTAPSTAPSTPPSGSEEPAGSEAPAASDQPTGGVAGATGTPRVTPPPTDALGVSQAISNDGWRVVLIGLAAILVATLTFTQPQRAARKR